MLRFKKLYFAPLHARLIRDGRLTTTWRLFDHAADIKIGNTVKLFDTSSGACFGKAVIISVESKTLGQINPQDQDGYESYPNLDTVYKSFSQYYGRPVGPTTPVRIIKFKLK